MTIKTANIIWSTHEPPVSTHYGDIYFSRQDGLGESRYVFLQGNHLPQRFQQANNQHFIIAETGFGLGLNFLTLWQLALEHWSNITTLHFISFEKHPMSLPDLKQALSYFPELTPLSEQLIAQWSPQQQGLQQLSFANNKIKLDLWLGDINDTINHIPGSYESMVDAWFLDGFTPSKNPDMWTDRLLEFIAKTTKQNGTFATFTSAGFVRRKLQQVGFDVKKIRGFRSKLEMLIGEKSHAE